MQEMFDAGVSPVQYQSQGRDYDFPDRTNQLCPQCKRNYLKRHGFYERYLITVGFEGIILIRRYVCAECQRTLSLLPSFCHSKRTYGIRAIIGLLREYYLGMKGVCHAVMSFMTRTGVECSRQLLLHYRERIEQNLNRLILAITEIYQLRAPPVTERTDKREKVRQLLVYIPSPQKDALKIYERTRISILTPLTN